MSNFIFTDQEREDINVKLLSLLLEKHFYNEIKEKVLQGLTGNDYIQQEQQLIDLYNQNFKKHD